ncbi:ATP-binding protein, partial [Dyella japonica]|uniref:ATP-binding protein n=1 Tax=Dyella japonica TaxID=231455 RepID=UPI000B24E13C
MQVADSTELTTSATLGAQDAMAFGISEDPAFFQILSANLYSNQKLAMVRETLCNSWDAHIEGNKTDIPIHVTIDKDGFLIFRDYGSGIPKDKIQEVYGVYGASTKKANTASTGGFGLGCKSPMAYTDSFTVTSMCDGAKTVYHIAKSSVETNGKPGIIPIVSVPTEESGLEVKIQLQSEDILEIDSYTRAIVL